jgi:hypothetical protein
MARLKIATIRRPVSRKEPSWLLSLIVGGSRKAELGSLLHEIYQAVHGGQFRLAAMGIRALLEQVMIANVGDLGSFDEKLKEFEKRGFASSVQLEALHSTIEVDHAAMHRAHKPTEEDIKLALESWRESWLLCTLTRRRRPRKWRIGSRLGLRLGDGNRADRSHRRSSAALRLASANKPRSG